MSTIKQDRIDLERLLNGVDPIKAPSAAPSNSKPAGSTVVDSAPPDAFPTENMFEYDYDRSKKQLRKQARKTIDNIIKHIIPDGFIIEDEYINDKKEQDIETLADLYMQREANEVMKKSIVETVSRGNTMPRMYEVFGQLSQNAQDINKQILDTEQKIRKTYMDLKYETMDRRSENMQPVAANTLTGGFAEKGIIASPRDLIAMTKKKHNETFLNAKETDCVVEK